MFPPMYGMGQTYTWALGIYAQMKRRELTPQQVSSVPCPTCGASVGHPCELLSGALRLKPHLNREFAAIEAIERK
jgi:hypothetical protein